MSPKPAFLSLLLTAGILLNGCDKDSAPSAPETASTWLSYDWEHPPLLHLDPPLVLEPGQGLRCIATYDNWTDRDLTFGLTREDEMMILYAYYYKD